MTSSFIFFFSPKVFTANFVAHSALDIFYLPPWFPSGSLKSARDRNRRCLSKMYLACLATCFVVPGTQMVLCNCVLPFPYSKIDPVSLCHGRKPHSTPEPPCKLVSGSQDAPIDVSSFCILEIGEGSQLSSFLALGRLPCSGSSILRHFMIHLWSFIPHRKGLLCSRLLFHLLIPISCQSNYFPQRK